MLFAQNWQITTHKLVFSVSEMSIKLHICKLEIPNKQQILIRATDRLKLEAKKCAILIVVEKNFCNQILQNFANKKLRKCGIYSLFHDMWYEAILSILKHLAVSSIKRYSNVLSRSSYIFNLNVITNFNPNKLLYEIQNRISSQ